MTSPHPSAETSERALTAWSAMPTPLTKAGEVDSPSVQRLIDHHINFGCEGVMLAGTCGEGPWLRRRDIELLVRTGVDRAGDKLKIAVQATDNSPGLVLERLELISSWGASLGVLAQPYFLMNATPKNVMAFYLEILNRTPIPLAFYDRGKAAAIEVPLEILTEIVGHPSVVLVKDSSCDLERFGSIRRIRNTRPNLQILTGNEFKLIEALESGYDGAFLGGLAVTGSAVLQCMTLFADGQKDEAVQVDAATQQLLYDVYGGPQFQCWLAGLKYMLVQLGIFSDWNNLLGYQLTQECREKIDWRTQRINQQ